MKVIFTPVAAVLLALPAALDARAEPAATKAQVIIHAEQSGAAIPADFLGFSFEKKLLSVDCFQPGHATLINLFANLGGGVLRIGANEGDSTFWSRTETSPLPAMKALGYSLKPLTIGPPSLDHLYAFAKQSGWRVIHGLNLGVYDPAMAADEAAYALQVGGSSVLVFEVGNEPNLYRKNASRAGLRPADYDYARYRHEIEGYYSAILAKTPRAPLGGPATTRFCNWLPDFVRDFKPQISLVATHGYALSGNEKDPQSVWFPSVENLLRPQKDKEPIWLPKLEAAKAAGIPCRIDEYNTCTNGGRRGISDIFAAALWNLDFMLDVAAHGGAGVNLHGAFVAKAGYSPFSYRDNRFCVNPIYYSLLLFHQAARGRMVAAVRQTEANLAAYAFKGDDHKLRVVLINKDLTHAVAASIAAGAPVKKAEVMRLTAPGATATEDITLAGSAVREDGTWAPRPGAAVQCVAGKCEVPVPAASAALLTIAD